MSSKQEKLDMQKKVMTILIAILFVGSIAGYALYGNGISINSNNDSSLPQARILEKPLNVQQRQVLFSNYGAYITSNIPNCGLICDSTSNYLQSLTQKYHPFVFLYENRSSENILITVEGFNGTKTINNLDNFDQEAFEDLLCANLHPSVAECKARRILSSS